MKIIDKIVTSNIPPQLLNVVWHNTATNELKIWGNKGWELVGGNPNASSGGYPVVTVEKDFNIEALPNTFYNIKNESNSLVSINFKDDLFGGNRSKIFLLYMDMEHMLNLDDYQSLAMLILSLGISVTPNSEYEGFKYKVIVNPDFLLNTPALKDAQFFISDIPTDNLQDETSSIDVLVIADVIGEEPMTITLPYIYTINKDIDYIAWYDLSNVVEEASSMQLPIIFTQEIGYDGEQYSYLGFIVFEYMAPCILYTQVEYTKADKVVVEVPYGSTSELTELPITVQPNKALVMPDEIKEFVFNLKSPANIVLSHTVSWNNDNTPDFTKSGTYTLSILNGVGCYTFI